MIRFDGLWLRRGAKLLVEDGSVVVHSGEKVGLTGANGSGKSSLFALVQGELSPDQGAFTLPSTWRIAHVAQESAASERSALDFVIDGDRTLRQIEDELAIGHAAPATSAGDDLRLAELHMAHGDAGGYTATSRAEALLLGLGFTLDEAARPVATFSGGWRMRLQLAQALMTPSDLLLLDEPTNHLDLDAVVWLEQWLIRYAGTLLVISHDREFLDAVCGVTLALEQRKLTRWSGNHSAYELQRAERLRLAATAFSAQQREIGHLQQFVDRFRAKASKAKQAQSRVKAMERMTLLAPVITASPFTFRFRKPLAAPDPMLVLEGVDCGYRIDDGARVVVRGVDLRLSPGERIGLLGANGQGKSTLVKTLAGTLAPLGGSITVGKGLAIGYFAQHQVDMLALDASPLEQLRQLAAATGDKPREQELRDYLGSFDFRGEMATAAVAPFSGGEKARLALALIIWSRPSLLLLDEPTNHLDLETREALTLALAQFDGTLILVSHDRALLRATTDRFLLVADGRCTGFDGDLEDYGALALKKKSAAAVAAPAPAPPVEKRRPAPTASRKPIEQRLRRIEARLAELEQRRKQVEAALASPEAYAEANREALSGQLVEQAYLVRDIEALEAEWLEQQAVLDEIATA